MATASPDDGRRPSRQPGLRSSHRRCGRSGSILLFVDQSLHFKNHIENCNRQIAMALAKHGYRPFPGVQEDSNAPRCGVQRVKRRRLGEILTVFPLVPESAMLKSPARAISAVLTVPIAHSSHRSGVSPTGTALGNNTYGYRAD